MAVTLFDAISVLSPNAVPLQDFTVTDNGKGVLTISKWNVATLGPQPTPSALAAVTQAQVDRAKQKRDDIATKAALAELATHPNPHLRAIYALLTTGVLGVVNDTRNNLPNKQSQVAASAVLAAVNADLDTKINTP